MNTSEATRASAAASANRYAECHTEPPPNAPAMPAVDIANRRWKRRTRSPLHFVMPEIILDIFSPLPPAAPGVGQPDAGAPAGTRAMWCGTICALACILLVLGGVLAAALGSSSSTASLRPTAALATSAPTAGPVRGQEAV